MSQSRRPDYTPEELELETWKEKLLYRFILEKKAKIRALIHAAAFLTIFGFFLGVFIGIAIGRLIAG